MILGKTPDQEQAFDTQGSQDHLNKNNGKFSEKPAAHDWQRPSEVPVQFFESTLSPEKTQRFGCIHLVPLFSKITASELRDLVPQLRPNQLVVGLDFPVSMHATGEEIRDSQGILLGFRYQNGTLNIDHHIPHDEMARPISTAPLVERYVREHGPVDGSNAAVVVHHVDADSLLSSLLLAGQLSAADPRFSEAAIAADHTGEPNRIADLLVALEPQRNLQLSLFCLHQLLKNRPLPEAAQQLLDQRILQRREVLKMVSDGLLQHVGNGVFLIESSQPLRSEFFPTAAKDAAVFVVAVPLENGNYEYKIRSGNRFPAGKRLNEMAIPHFGGRWNAGGTKRQGPVPTPPLEYAKLVAAKLAE